MLKPKTEAGLCQTFSALIDCSYWKLLGYFLDPQSQMPQ